MGSKQFATAAEQALTSLTHGQPSSPTSLVAKPLIRMPESIEEARALRTWAMSVRDPDDRASPEEVARHLDFLAATLPSKGATMDAAKKRLAVYVRFLGEYSNEALAFMASRACETLDWFPTPRQCLDILRAYRPSESDRERALGFCRHFAQRQMEAFLARLRNGEADQADIDSQPRQWRMVAVEQGYLRWLADEDLFVPDPMWIAQRRAA